MAERTTHLRVREGTLFAMRQLVEEMTESVRRGRGKRFWGDGPLTLPALVEELVSRELAHRERSRKAGRRKPSGPPAEVLTTETQLQQLPGVDPEADAQDEHVAQVDDWLKEFERGEKAGR